MTRTPLTAFVLLAIALATLPTPAEAAPKLRHYVHEAKLPAATVQEFWLAWPIDEPTTPSREQWLYLKARKGGGETFQVWLLTTGYPPETLQAARPRTHRFIIRMGEAMPLEFRNTLTGQALLPALGGWPHLVPRFAPDKPPTHAEYLGHPYQLAGEEVFSETPPPARTIELNPDLLVGVASNSRQKDETRRYDGSEYELVRLSQEDLHEMAAAGMTCLRVDAEQRGWIEDLNVFYWGLGGKDLPYPEGLYDSRYLGPTLFLDEPAVHTRDSILRPRLARDETFRQSITPQAAFDAFRDYFDHAWPQAAATALIAGLAARPDVNVGSMKFREENLFSWETMVSTAAYQLAQDPHVPAAIVFEPPGRVGTLRTLPEINMTYGCNIPVDDPKNFIDIIYGFLRGAARLTNKQWGTSIYGAVDRADAPWFLTHAYDLGATRFFFWDNAQLACVPYHECLALARHLKSRAENRPTRDLDRLLRAGEVAILLPPGYNLGHVQMGKGSLWGVSELNLERTNTHGIRYRQVMSNFFIEIERCLRLGVAFDLLWDLPSLPPSGYREVVRILEDGHVEITENARRTLLDSARIPARPAGLPPSLDVTLSATAGPRPLHIEARAIVVERTAPVYYTYGTDTAGVYHNAMVAWELYGPREEDYRVLAPPALKPRVRQMDHSAEVTVEFTLDHPGTYRLRAASVDLAGRNTVTWKEIRVRE